ncbi:hypothetical protein [Streptomyces sp. B93]|uniref:hypothetical protein n=1 Tax=Streptomyces sp. B93 TaxID=2824875 RepID=UPI001B3959EE|nr:hypothetical protein [Streptomyces sp. B93]MBQ1089654.1 hypothetical protein [Streptomyces sp. B93]
MKDASNAEGLHPKLGQIVDLESLQETFSFKDKLESHKTALEQKLEDFYALTGTSEAFFNDTPFPNTSWQIYAKWVKLRHDYRYQIPNYNFLVRYIDLIDRVNEMLFRRDFDECLESFRSELQELTEEKVEKEFLQACSSGLQEELLEKFEASNKDESSPITEEDKENLKLRVADFLKRDYGWSDAECAKLIRSYPW